MNEREPQPFTAEDLKLGEKIVMELHGIDGFAGWSEYIAKAIAALRSPPLAAGSEAVAWQKQFIAYLAETVDMMSATPRQREVYKASLKYAISHAVRKTAVAHPPSPSPDGTKAEPDSKLVYVKRWRTLVRLPIKYADEIVAALAHPQLQGGGTKSAPAATSSLPSGESDPSVMLDYAGAGTVPSELCDIADCQMIGENLFGGLVVCDDCYAKMNKVISDSAGAGTAPAGVREALVLLDQLKARADCIRATNFVHISEQDARDFAEIFDKSAATIKDLSDRLAGLQKCEDDRNDDLL